MDKKPLKFAIIAGEESGDLLGADLMRAIIQKTKRPVELIGVGGAHLQSLGLQTQFDSDEIALMGLGAVLKKLPKLMSHIRNLAKFIWNEKPDCLIVIDSPDFTHRVAKKVRALAPDIPIVKYIAPSVWAWRPERAKAMRDFIDLVLVVLPFEEQVMQELSGPAATYVGHRLLGYAPLTVVREVKKLNHTNNNETKTLLVLPGSRRFEIRGLMPIFGEAIKILKKRHPSLKIVLPTLPKIADEVHKLAKDWQTPVEITVGEEAKWHSFMNADAALAASGTVSLELALAKIPMVLCYKADLFSKTFILPKITIWSAALPNIIADKPIVPEYFNEFLRPGMLARQLEQLLVESHTRQAQIESFDRIEAIMKTDRPAGDIAADAVLELLTTKVN